MSPPKFWTVSQSGIEGGSILNQSESELDFFNSLLVFTDAEMPGTLNGIGLAHYIRKRWPRVKLIVVSGKREIGSDELPAGARFFHKPYRETSIVEAMIGMLSGVS
jgi:FixJ family two-component response regulator